jgi:hypothetical protein
MVFKILVNSSIIVALLSRQGARLFNASANRINSGLPKKCDMGSQKTL